MEFQSTIVIEKFPEDEEIIAIWIDASFPFFSSYFSHIGTYFCEWMSKWSYETAFRTIKIN